MDAKTLLPLLITVALAFIGYLATYLNNLATARRKDRLERISSQLRNLYGPLLITEQSAAAAWSAFRMKYRPGRSYWGDATPPTEEEAAAWRLWMSEVFMPLNLRMEQTLLANADLIDAEVMPDSVLALEAHIASFKPLLKRWEEKDYSQHKPLLGFPGEELRTHVVKTYEQLKRKQQKLLGK